MSVRFLRSLICCAALVGGVVHADPLEEAAAAHQAGDYRMALLQFKTLAAQGDKEAQYRLGTMYSQGQGVPVNYDQAVHWLREAATQEHRLAARTLGEMYQEGTGVPRDEQESAKWIALARRIAEREGYVPESGECD